MAPEPSSIIEVARVLRAGIYAGRYPPGKRVPTRERLAAEHGVSPESAGAAMRILRDEGLLSLEQGRGTFVLARHLYCVTVTLRYLGTLERWESAGMSLAAAVSREADAEPSVQGGAGVLPAFGMLAHVSMTTDVANWAQAVRQAHTVLGRALAGLPVVWDLLRAKIEVTPAVERAQ